MWVGLARPAVHANAAIGIKLWFTIFGTVEGHLVRQRQPEWQDAQCIQEAIAHAAPALARPSGRVIRQPLPGLYCPQVVITRLSPFSQFRTVVFDLRPVGADVRTEDVRVHRGAVDVFRGEGALAPLCERLGLTADRLAFSVNLQYGAVAPAITEDTDTVTVHLRADIATEPAIAHAAVPHPHASSLPSDRNLAMPSVSEDHRRGADACRGSRPPEPSRSPMPPAPDGGPEATAVGPLSFLGLQYTVFDVHFHKRILPRHAGQAIADLAAQAVASTPAIQHPWGFRVNEHIWDDLPVPQITIWGNLGEHNLVLPIRNLEQPEEFCTVEVPRDATPLYACVAAGISCDTFRPVRHQVARQEKAVLVNHAATPPNTAHALRDAHIAAVLSLTGPVLPASRCTGRWRPVAPPHLHVLSPGGNEDLWPVLEIVVHFQHMARNVIHALLMEVRSSNVQGRGTASLVARHKGARTRLKAPASTWTDGRQSSLAVTLSSVVALRSMLGTLLWMNPRPLGSMNVQRSVQILERLYIARIHKELLTMDLC